MSATKLLTQYGVAATIEAAYGDGAAPTLAQDGVIPMEVPEVELEYIHDGTRGRSPTGGRLTGVAQSGLGATFSLMTHVYLPGIAYAAAVYPNIHDFLRMAGFGATGDFTGAAETWTYAPVSDQASLESGSIEVYNRGQLYDVHGAYANLQIVADGPVIPAWTFEVQGIGNLPTEIALPAITYRNFSAGRPGKAVNIGLVLDPGSPYSAAILRSFEFNMGRDMSPRANDNTSGNAHAGFSPGDRDPRLTLLIELPALATFNPYSLRDLATEIDVAIGPIGTGQYDQYTLNFNQMQIADVNDVDDGPSAMVELELVAGVSAPGLEDDIEILFD